MPILKDRLIGRLAEQFERAQYNRSKKYSLLMLLFSVVNAVRLVTVVALYALTPGITEALIKFKRLPDISFCAFACGRGVKMSFV